MKSYILGALLLLLTGLSCQKDLGLIQMKNHHVDSETTTSYYSLGRRPFKAKSAGTLTFVGLCNEGVLFQVEGEGNATHLGKFGINFTFCTSAGFPIAGQLTAANGDILKVEIYAEENLENENIQYVRIRAGSTGRFVEASGEWTNRGQVDLASNTFMHESSGWIKY